MKNIALKNRAAIINIVCVLLFLTTSSACTREPQIIEGKVVDESNAALSGVAVTACYSGWGWSSGQLVWDKDYCSESVMTNKDGHYVINFKGPEFIRLRAKKIGWVHTTGFNARDSRIILTSNSISSARNAAEAKLREESFRQRLSDESDEEYYCRVVISRNRPVTLTYQGGTLAITPSVLLSDHHSAGLFAVRGPARIANIFAREATYIINGKTVKVDSSYRQGGASCEPDIHFIGMAIPGLQLETNDRLEIFIPSIRAMFDMQTWIDTVTP